MDRKMKAAAVLMLLVVCFVMVGLATTPDLGFFLNQNLTTFFNLGNTVGLALANAFGNRWFHLIGIFLFIA